MAQPQPPSLSAELGRVTGDQVDDLRTLSNVAWFVFNPASVNTKAITADPIGYVAFGKQYFGVSVDWNAVARWESTADHIDAIAAGLLTGVQGAEDVRTLDAFFDAVTALTDYLTTRAPQFRRWAGNAGAPGVGLGGSAVGLITSALNRYAETLDGWRSSLRTASGVPLAGGIDGARVLLRQWNHDVAGSWADVQRQGLRGRIRQGIDSVIEAVRNHLVGTGIILGTPNYLFDDWDPAATQAIVTQADIDEFHARAGDTIISALGSFPQGSLQSPATWAAINQAITASVTPLLDQVSAVARERRVALQTKYVDLMTGLDPSAALIHGQGDPDETESPPPGGNGDPGDFARNPAGDSRRFGENRARGSAEVPGPGFTEVPGPGFTEVPGPGFTEIPGPGFPGAAAAAFAAPPDLNAQPPPPGPGLTVDTTVDLGTDPGQPSTFPTDVTAGPGVLAGSVIGGSAALRALRSRSSAPDQDDEADDRSDAAVIAGTAGVFLVPPAGARVGPGGDVKVEEERASRAAGAAAQAGSLSATTISAGTAVPPAAEGISGPAGTASVPSAFGTAERPGPAGLGVSMTDPALAIRVGGSAGDSGFDAAALDSRIGGGGRAGLPRPAEPLMIPASPASAYQSPGWWPPGLYGPSATQFAGSPVGYGTADPPGGFGGRIGDRLRFRDRLQARETPGRLAALYGNELGGPTRRPEGRDEPYRSDGGDRSRSTASRLRIWPDRDSGVADDELDRGRVVPHEPDKSWAPFPDRRADGVVVPVDDSETPQTYASVATVGLVVGAAQRRDDDDDDDEYQDKPRRGLADGVVDAGGE